MSYYEIKITGKDVKRFIHNLHKMHIEFFNIKFVDNSVIIKVNKEDFQKIKKIKTIYNIEIIKLQGLAYVEYFIKKYSLFLIILILASIIFLGLTNMIFEIEVVHTDVKIRELLTEELKKEGLSKYRFISSYKTKENIKESIIKKYKDKIEWLEIDRKGTKYIVKVEERKLNNEINDNTPSNVIAKKNGLIKKITSTSGEIVVAKNQYVKKGDILISGIIHNKEEVVGTVKAEGEIYAETWYNVEVTLPYHYHEETKTNNKQKILTIDWFNKKINLFQFKKYKNSIIETNHQLKNNVLPISISINTEEETNVIDKIYTRDNAIKDASNIAKNKLISSLGQNIEILYEKNLKITEEDSKIKIVMFYKIYENITDYQNIIENIEDKIE